MPAARRRNKGSKGLPEGGPFVFSKIRVPMPWIRTPKIARGAPEK